MLCACVNCSVIVDSKVVVAIVDDAIKLCLRAQASPTRGQSSARYSSIYSGLSASVGTWAAAWPLVPRTAQPRRCRVRAPLQHAAVASARTSGPSDLFQPFVTHTCIGLMRHAGDSESRKK